MPTPEHAPLTCRAQLLAELDAVQDQLEIIDSNENPLERFIYRNELLMVLDSIEAELDMLPLLPDKG